MISSTTLEDSTVGVEEGDSYTWENYYIYPTDLLIWGCCVGNKITLKIEIIYRGAYLSIDHTLIMNITEGSYSMISTNTTYTNYPEYVVYNQSLHFIELETPHIIPIPLNLTLLAEYYESLGENCTVEGNTLIFDDGVVREQHTYNSDGILTNYRWKHTDGRDSRWGLLGTGEIDVPLPIIIIASISIVG
ncbi:MAG: hypothetical protein KAX18_10345, partial [Candidatus Lokiarchaeota archaeon]|nr:hypothetical protein [Candidatus Lokiarchaeota archaeon]